MGAIERVSRAVRIPADIATGVVVAPGRVRQLWHELEGAVTQARIVVERAGRAVTRAESDLDDLEVLTQRFAMLGATARAELEAAADLLATARRLKELYEPVLRSLAPVASEAAERVRPDHVRGVSRLLDLVPQVLDQIEPALRNLASLAPELEQVTERVDNVGQIVEGLPGAKLLQRRGRAKENGPAED